MDRIAATTFRPVGEGKLIALLAGSRSLELRFLMPRFVALEDLMQADPRFAGYRLVVAAASSLPEDLYRKYLPASSHIEVVSGRTYDVLHQADAAVVCSGTASLEAALIGTPQVVCYGLHPLTYAIAKHTVRVPYISLANLCLNRSVFPELVQGAATPERMLKELERLLWDASCRNRMAADYEELKQMLGDAGAAARIAEDMHETFARI